MVSVRLEGGDPPPKKKKKKAVSLTAFSQFFLPLPLLLVTQHLVIQRNEVFNLWLGNPILASGDVSKSVAHKHPTELSQKNTCLL